MENFSFRFHCLFLADGMKWDEKWMRNGWEMNEKTFITQPTDRCARSSKTCNFGKIRKEKKTLALPRWAFVEILTTTTFTQTTDAATTTALVLRTIVCIWRLFLLSLSISSTLASLPFPMPFGLPFSLLFLDLNLLFAVQSHASPPCPQVVCFPIQKLHLLWLFSSACLPSVLVCHLFPSPVLIRQDSLVVQSKNVPRHHQNLAWLELINSNRSSNQFTR